MAYRWKRQKEGGRREENAWVGDNTTMELRGKGWGVMDETVTAQGRGR
jgi:hypothetical protein